MWGWYNYISAKKYLVRDVCTKCVVEIEDLLTAHADPCGCTFELVIIRGEHRGTKGPVQIQLEDIQKRLNAKEVCDV